MSKLNRLLISLFTVLATVVAVEVLLYFNVLSITKNPSKSIGSSNVYNFSLENKNIDMIQFSKILNLALLSKDDTFKSGQIETSLNGYLQSVTKSGGLINVYLTKEKNSVKGPTMYFVEANVKFLDKSGSAIKMEDFKLYDTIQLHIVYNYNDNVFYAEIKKLQ